MEGRSRERPCLPGGLPAQSMKRYYVHSWQDDSKSFSVWPAADLPNALQCALQPRRLSALPGLVESNHIVLASHMKLDQTERDPSPN